MIPTWRAQFLLSSFYFYFIFPITAGRLFRSHLQTKTFPLINCKQFARTLLWPPPSSRALAKRLSQWQHFCVKVITKYIVANILKSNILRAPNGQEISRHAVVSVDATSPLFGIRLQFGVAGILLMPQFLSLIAAHFWYGFFVSQFCLQTKINKKMRRTRSGKKRPAITTTFAYFVAKSDSENFVY